VSYEEIILEKDREIAYLKHELETLKRMIYGIRSEKFKSLESPLQLSLFDEQQVEQEQEELPKEQISYQRTKPAKNHSGRNELPEHLPVQEEIIEPEEDTTGLVKIGEEITETLEYTPASLIKKRIIRPKYAAKEGQGVLIAALPPRPIDKGIAEASLLAHIIICKFVDHLPFYRQIKRFKRDYGWEVSSSTINDWFKAVSILLEPLYNVLKQKIMDSGYIQVDESPIKVLDSDKSGSTHQGYQWVYYSPEEKLVLFNYRKGRGQHGPKELLESFQGYLQCDGYTVYDKLGMKSGIDLAGCLIHARRKFFEAKDSDAIRANYALKIIGQIYHHEQEAKGMDPQQRKAYRDVHTKGLVLSFREWVDTQALKVLPKSPIGKAMTYFVNQWPKLIALWENGRLELDNNLIENKIRPLALGRKNYLFAGSHQGAQRIAIIYSFLGSCAAQDVNPYEWLKTTLDKIPSTKLSELERLLPNSKM